MSRNLTWISSHVTQKDRASQKNQSPKLIWFTGLSGSGKSTIACALEQELFKRGFHTYILDGDNIRHGINKDLGFSDEGRTENIRRIGEIAKLFVDAGLIVISAFISPFKEEREVARSLFKEGEFIEVYMNAPLSVCENRDAKGLYKKARQGIIKDFTGIDSIYEEPERPTIELNTSKLSVDECVERLLTSIDES